MTVAPGLGGVTFAKSAVYTSTAHPAVRQNAGLPVAGLSRTVAATPGGRMMRRWGWAAASLVMAGGVHAAEPEYDQGPPAAWIDTTLAPHAGASLPGARGGVEYLLLDRQLRFDRGVQEYVRVVFRPTNAAGVESQSRIGIEFDPTRERLTLHRAVSRRGDTVVDQLAVGHRSMLRRESELERNIVDGRLTLNLLLHDLRAGDVVDYSYTLERRPSGWGDRVHAAATAQWSAPLGQGRFRVLAPAERRLAVRGEAPTRTTLGGMQHLEWRWQNVPGLADEADRPRWYAYFPEVEVSEYVDWTDVAERAVPMYAVPETLSPALEARLAQFRAIADPAAQIVAVLRFVQDEIRYTGLSIGEGAYVPTAPTTVLARRYGDCKDKALLAVTWLRALGHEAAPALVSVERGPGVRQRLPSPGAFDHAIVRVTFAGRRYWIDPTVTSQGGTLETLEPARFGVALPIERGATLVDLPNPEPTAPQRVASVTLDLSAGEDAPATLEVVTERLGAEADSFRRTLENTSLEQIGEHYLTYYRDRHPTVSAVGPLAVEDDRERNRIVVTERYRIEQPFTAGERGERTLDLQAEDVTALLESAAVAGRHTPLVREFPKRVRQTIRVQLPEDWPIEHDEQQITAPAFVYASSVTPDGDAVEFAYDYRATADHVVPADIGRFAAAQEQARLDTFITLTSRGARAGEPWAVAVAPLLATGAGLVVGLLVVTWLRRGDQTWWRRDRKPPGPVGVGGWMLLPSLQAWLIPAVLVWASWEWREVFDASVYAGFGESPDPAFATWGRVIATAGPCGALALLLVALWSLRLWLRRDAAYPASYIVLVWSAWTWGSLIAYADLHVSSAGQFTRWLAETLRDGLFALLWTVYMLASTRVRSTFTRGLREPPAMTTPPAEVTPTAATG